MYRSTPLTRWLKGFSLPFLALMAVVISGCLGSRVGFQGQLTDPGGNPVPDGDYNMTVRFFPTDSGGTSVFTETKTVSVENGLFNMDVDDFPPHIFSGETTSEDTLYMEVEVEGETLQPRRKVSGSPYAHALVAGSGVIGARQDEANVTDGGYHAALTVVNTEQPNNDPGYGVMAKAANAGLHVDNLQGDGSLSESASPEDNPDIILGGEYVSDVDGGTDQDAEDGPGVIASDTDYNFSDIYLRSNDELELYKSYDAGAVSEFRIYDGPRLDSNIQLRLDQDGNLSAEGTVTGGGADFAERIDVEGQEADYEPGDVLVISDEQDRAVELAREAQTTRVIGVYSANPGFLGGAGTPDEQVAQQEEALAAAGAENDEAAAQDVLETLKFEDGAVEVAIAGIVPVKVSAENGAIRRGDLLTTSDTAGHAMKASDPVPGTILGKAMGTLDEGTGVIDVLVMLQ